MARNSDQNKATRLRISERELDLIIRQSYEKLTALFIKVHNLQVEVSELRKETKATRAVLLALLGDPQTRHEAEAVLRDLKFNLNKTSI